MHSYRPLSHVSPASALYLRPDIGANQRISSLLLKIPDGWLRSISRPEFVHERPHNDFRRAIGNAEFPANDLIRVALA